MSAAVGGNRPARAVAVLELGDRAAPVIRERDLLACVGQFARVLAGDQRRQSPAVAGLERRAILDHQHEAAGTERRDGAAGEIEGDSAGKRDAAEFERVVACVLDLDEFELVAVQCVAGQRIVHQFGDPQVRHDARDHRFARRELDRGGPVAPPAAAVLHFAADAIRVAGPDRGGRNRHVALERGQLVALPGRLDFVLAGLLLVDGRRRGGRACTRLRFRGRQANVDKEVGAAADV